MPYNAKLETMIDSATKRWQDLVKKRMFGGICYLVKGSMCFGIWKDFLIVRLDKEQAEQSLKDKNANVKPFDITGRPMAGWVMVSEKGWKSKAALEKWLKIGKEYALTLPPKADKSKAKKKKTLREYRGWS